MIIVTRAPAPRAPQLHLSIRGRYAKKEDNIIMDHGVDFGGFRFEPPSGRLWFGEREIRLTPKAAGVLAALVARAGELVTKQELFASLWGDVAVSDDALTSCVQELRKALADNVKQPRFIETRHRRGYRFIAPLSGASPDESGAVIARPVNAVAGLPAREGKPTVVVLPFANMSGDADQEYFTDGITEDIITALSKHRSLLVIARGSAFAFKGRPVDVRQARADLGADYIVDGSVVRSGQRLRISARLVETEGGRHVWAERYDRDVEAVFELRDEITTAIAARIAPEVGTAERQRTERKSPEAFRAWDFFHLGMKHVYKGTAEDNKEAQRLLQRAIDLDPELAEAYGWLSYAIVLSMIYFDADPDDDRMNRSIALARKGVELDDQDALTHFTYGRALLAGRAYDDALAEFESAAELNPSLAMVYCGLAIRWRMKAGLEKPSLTSRRRSASARSIRNAGPSIRTERSRTSLPASLKGPPSGHRKRRGCRIVNTGRSLTGSRPLDISRKSMA
jgi:TolB-like protein